MGQRELKMGIIKIKLSLIGMNFKSICDVLLEYIFQGDQDGLDRGTTKGN